MQLIGLTRFERVVFFVAAGSVIASSVMISSLVLTAASLEFKDALAAVIAGSTGFVALGAYLVSLGQSTKAAREAAEQARDKALLVAAGIADHLNELSGDITSQIARTVFGSEREWVAALYQTLHFHRTLRESAARIAFDSIWDLDLATLEALIPLGDHTANRLNTVCGLARALRQELTDQELERLDKASLNQSALQIRRMTSKIRGMDENLRHVLEVLDRAAAISAPLPPDEPEDEWGSS